MQKEPSIPPLCGPCLMFYICLSRPGFYQHSSTSMLESSNQKVLSKNFVNMMWVIFHINSLFYINIQARRKRCQGIQRSYGFMHAYQPVRCRPDHWLGTGVDLLYIKSTHDKKRCFITIKCRINQSFSLRPRACYYLQKTKLSLKKLKYVL